MIHERRNPSRRIGRKVVVGAIETCRETCRVTWGGHARRALGRARGGQRRRFGGGEQLILHTLAPCRRRVAHVDQCGGLPHGVPQTRWGRLGEFVEQCDRIGLPGCSGRSEKWTPLGVHPPGADGESAPLGFCRAAQHTDGSRDDGSRLPRPSSNERDQSVRAVRQERGVAVGCARQISGVSTCSPPRTRQISLGRSCTGTHTVGGVPARRSPGKGASAAASVRSSGGGASRPESKLISRVSPLVGGARRRTGQLCRRRRSGPMGRSSRRTACACAVSARR